MRIIATLILMSCLQMTAFAQSLTQNIKGTVTDKDTGAPLIGATILITNREDLGTVTDYEGNFILEDVPVGRQNIQTSYTGYEANVKEGIILNSAKELYLEIQLVETAFTTGPVIVTGKPKTSKANNAAAVLSTRSFTAEETSRYAASANDPGRMAMSLPGVQPTRDTRSDIVIRGNSSVGLLWRLEGIDIPNPNHFARRGTSGGGITIFSISMLSNSDFSVGAFPAEYGNAFSGAFDIKFRNGNKEEREHTFRAGLLGLDFATEGPINKETGSSYLVNYRYSTLGILNDLGFHLVGERIDNNFQDLSFKLNFPSKNKKSNISFWGMGGLSVEEESPVEPVEDWKTFDDKTAYKFETNMGALGMTHSYLINNDSYIKSTIAVMGQQVVQADDTVAVDMNHTNINKEDFTNSRVSLHSFYSRKFSPRFSMKTGLIATMMSYDLQHDSLDYNTFQYREILNTQGNSALAQPYAQFRYRATDKLDINFGAHGMYLALNGSTALEPRLGLQYQLPNNQAVSLAYGLHSRMLPIGSYFAQAQDEMGNLITPNQELPFMKAHHLVLGYDKVFGEDYNLHIEGYYQYLYDIPTSPNANSTYWMLNDIQGYATRALVAEGIGRNMGVDVSFEKYYNKGVFFIASGSVFNSQYKPLDKSRWYNTQYNSRYAATFIGGKAWSVGENNSFELGFKALYSGGLPITPLLEGAETTALQPVLDESQAFELQVANYFRPDLRLAFRKNNEKTAWWIALDVQNVINRRNIDGLNRSFDPTTNAWVDRLQSGLTPILSFQIDF